MKKEQIDELYHLLRTVSSDEREPYAAFNIQSAVYGLTRHLLAGGDYLSLIQFSQYYGERFLLGPTADAIRESGLKFERIFEFGAGLGWLARGLAIRFDKGYVTVDKRPWGGLTIVANLETEAGVISVKSKMRKGDLIVMSDVLHCIDDPVDLLENFIDWPVVALEYSPANPEYVVSYSTQIARYGASPLAPDELEMMFTGRDIKMLDIEPYTLVLADKGG